MSRTSASDVKDIYSTDLPDTSVDAHITAASQLVDDIENAGNLTTGRLKTIESYLAAHFVSLQDPRLTSETIGSNEEDYERKSTYLETAMLLDTTNTLDTEPSEQANVYVPEGR